MISSPPTGTVTFLFTDIEGSTVLWERDREAMQAALAQHHAILRDSIETNGGHVFNIVGDAFCAAFATAQHLKIVTSSREALGIAGEATYHVPSLPVPNPQLAFASADLAQYDAVRLFTERAVAAKSNFALNDANAPAVAHICYRLDGIPLALELAAARVRVIPPEQIVARLDDRFRLLTGGSRTALPRQQTLRALINWSYDLLSKPERLLLQRLSVFAGGWMLEAAEEVASSNPAIEARRAGEQVASDSSSNALHLPHATSNLPLTDVLELLTRLVDKSLVLSDEQTVESRYRMLETIRQYAHEKLLETGEDEHVRDAHLDFFMHLAEKAEPKLLSPEQEVWMNRLEMEHGNLRAAIEWALTSGKAVAGLRLAGALRLFWLWRGYWSEGLDSLKDALSQPAAAERTSARAKVLITMGHLLRMVQINYADARRVLEEGLAIAQEIGDKHSMALARLYLGSTFTLGGDPAAGRIELEESVLIFRQLGDHAGMGESLELLADSFRFEGDYERAKTLYQESVALLRQLGDGYHLGYALRGLGAIANRQENVVEAIAAYHDSLKINLGLRNKRGVAASLIGMAGTAAARGQSVTAARLCSAADWLLESTQIQLMLADRAEYERNITAIRAHLDPMDFDIAWAEGRALTMEQAIEMALDSSGLTGQRPE